MAERQPAVGCAGAVAQRAAGSGKIAAVIQAQTTRGATTVLRYAKGRGGVYLAGDETSVLDADSASVYRLCWNASMPVAAPVLDSINRVLS